MLPEGLWCALAGLYGARYCQGAGLALAYPSWLRAVPAPYQYPRGSHASRATIITERDCCQSGIGIPGYPGYPGYPGWLRLLGEAGEGAYLFSTFL